MYVKRLKAMDIMVANVECIDEDEMVALAKLKMIRHGIGGLPVTKDGKIRGIITHRDTTLAGDKVQNLKVKEIMTREVTAVNKDTRMKEIVDIMKNTGYQRLPVVEDGRVIGIVTQSSVINAIARYL